MSIARPLFERRVMTAVEASPSRIPVVLGGCGTGRTGLLYALRDRIGRSASQYINVERTATTPERFLRALVADSPYPPTVDVEASMGTARQAFDATLAFFDQSRGAGGGPATFLLDEAFEFRTFESFPGLRHVLRDLLQALASSPNRFVLTSRYVARAHRSLREATSRFEVVHVMALTPTEVRDAMADPVRRTLLADEAGLAHLARTVHALADGRPAYVRALLDGLAEGTDARGVPEPAAVLAGLMSPGGVLYRQCGFCYELRLHRARGYGALKAILEILGTEEPLTLTEISRRLFRTPGSTKDYLSWLEDVDLITSRQKRYSFTDPLLRLWVRLHCRPTPPSGDDIRREVQGYAMGRVPAPEPAMALVGSREGGGEVDGDRGKEPWGIIEID